MNAVVKKLLEDKIEEISTVLRKKYPDVEIKTPFTTDTTRYDHTGNKALHNYYYSKFDCKIVNKESSHPGLARPFVTFTVSIAIENGHLSVNVSIHTDSVDVNYITFEKKINKRNVAIARQQRRQVVKYLYGAFKTKVAHSYDLTQSENEAFEQSLRQLKKEKNLKALIHNKLSRSVKDLPKGGQCPHTNIKRVANSFFLGDNKIGTKDEVTSYIKQNIKKIIPDFDSQYPEIAKSIAEKVSA